MQDGGRIEKSETRNIQSVVDGACVCGYMMTIDGGAGWRSTGLRRWRGRSVSSMMIVDCVSSSLTAVRRRFTDWPPTSPTVPQRQPGCPVL